MIPTPRPPLTGVLDKKYLEFYILWVMKHPYRPVVFLAPGSALMGRKQTVSAFSIDSNPDFSNQVAGTQVQPSEAVVLGRGGAME